MHANFFYYIYVENMIVLNLFFLHVYRFKIVCTLNLPWTIFYVLYIFIMIN